MGHENNCRPFKVYIDGQPVEIGHHLPEITLDYSAGGISAEEASAAMAAVSKVWADVIVTVEVAAEGIQALFRAMELAIAVNAARMLEPAMAHRYLHAKKKRIRKKYEKRIRAWFREVFL